jgi:hypothetical protein
MASGIERLDSESLEARLRRAANLLQPDRVMDGLELQHLRRVITVCSMLLTDVYSESRIARIMYPEEEFLNSLIDQMIEQERRGDREVLHRVRRLPDDARVVGDKALFDLGLQGLREVKGYDLAELGTRAYMMAGSILELLSQDHRLLEFFEANRLLMLPLKEEVIFLRQCSERFNLYAEILRRAQEQPLGCVAIEFVRPPAEKPNNYLAAAQGEARNDSASSREQLLSLYERILLFSSLDMERLRDALDATVIDQQQAVEALCDEFSLFAAGTRDRRKPPAYFLVGPTGVGKNHLVESLCRLLEGVWKIEIPALTIEGPSYTYPSDINELRGATRGFIRSDEEGLLTSFHERSSNAPLGVILIDEVEKAHAQLLTFFLSILDRGTTTDNRGSILNFSNCMLFFTSNMGYSDAQQRASRIGYHDQEARAHLEDRDVRRELRRALKPEFVNRIRMIHFNRLSISSAERILDLELERIAKRYRELHGLHIELRPSARAELIRSGFSPTFGARHLAATLESVCNVEIAKKVRSDDRSPDCDREALVGWLREMRSGRRSFEAGEVDRRVKELARARLGYDTLRVTFRDGRFGYTPAGTDNE